MNRSNVFSCRNEDRTMGSNTRRSILKGTASAQGQAFEFGSFCVVVAAGRSEMIQFLGRSFQTSAVSKRFRSGCMRVRLEVTREGRVGSEVLSFEK